MAGYYNLFAGFSRSTVHADIEKLEIRMGNARWGEEGKLFLRLKLYGGFGSLGSQFLTQWGEQCVFKTRLMGEFPSRR